MTEYSVIAIDSPWHEPGGNGKGSDDHYQTIRTVDGIAQTILGARCWRPATDCLAFLWTTMTSLPSALELMRAIDFEYKTHGVWVKVEQRYADDADEPLWRTLEGAGANALEDVLSFGIGQYFRGAHELFLVGSRGRGFNVKTDAKDIPSVLFAPVPRRELVDGQKHHSAKPDEWYDMVARRTRGERLDMFARKARPGWAVWP